MDSYIGSIHPQMAIIAHGRKNGSVLSAPAFLFPLSYLEGMLPLFMSNNQSPFPVQCAVQGLMRQGKTTRDPV